MSPPPLKVPDLMFSGPVLSLLTQADGNILVGGYFTSVNGFPIRGLARVNADGTLDADWNLNMNGSVSVLASGADGVTYVGGDFSQIGGYLRHNIAKISADGSVDENWDPSASSSVTSLAMDGSDALFVGGYFTTIGGLAKDRLARVSTTGEGETDPDWTADLDIGPAYALALSGDELFVGGAFTMINGVARDHAAKLSRADGSVVSGWNPSPDGYVYDMLLADDHVYLAGGFEEVGGVPRRFIAKVAVHGAGTLDADWNPAANGEVLTLAFGPDATLYAGGGFTAIGGQPRNRIARLNLGSSGVADPDWNPSAGSPVNALSARVGGPLYVGGNFQSIGGQTRWFLAALPHHALGDPIFASGFDD